MTIPSHFVANFRYFLWSNMPHCQICLTQNNERQLHDLARNAVYCKLQWTLTTNFNSLKSAPQGPEISDRQRHEVWAHVIIFSF